MNKQELIERIEGLKNLFGSKAEYIEIDMAIRLISELDEPQEVIVPQFVAEFITEQKKLGHMLSYSIDACMSDIVAEWYWDNSELFVRAWLDGYTVEEEKRYYVRFKFIEEAYSYLTLIKHLNTWTLTSIKLDKKFRSEHTKKQLEYAGFGWVFDCPGIEIEEVEE